MKVVENAKASAIKFEDLKEGQCFRFADEPKGELCMKTDYDQDAVCLQTGEYYMGLCGEKVIPVNAEIHIIR